MDGVSKPAPRYQRVSELPTGYEGKRKAFGSPSSAFILNSTSEMNPLLAP